MTNVRFDVIIYTNEYSIYLPAGVRGADIYDKRTEDSCMQNSAKAPIYRGESCIEELPYMRGIGQNRGRVVLHCDLNCFFASVECSEDPSLREHPVAVCGDPDMRHGIILAKNEIAKKYGVSTGEPIFSAKKKCPSLVTVRAHYDLYMRYSRAARKIYLRYTDRVEPFGMDEAWLELSGGKNIDDGKRIADEIREVIKNELGVTLSVGVSDNKIFAKLGSDFKKPDATTVLSPAQYETVSRMPVSEILFAGAKTTARLRSFGLLTVGDVALCNPVVIKSILGKNGMTLRSYCRGEDVGEVALFGEKTEIKSVGNSTTPPKDITSFYDAKLVLSSLCDNVSSRLREENLKCRGVCISFRDTSLVSFERRMQLDSPTSNARELLSCACEIFLSSVDVNTRHLRSIGVRAVNLVKKQEEVQMSLFSDSSKRDIIDGTVDKLRERFGFSSIFTALDLCDSEKLGHIAKGYEVFTNLR